MLSNFADSIFAMGTSRTGSDVRYLKRIKHRSSAGRASETEVAAIRLAKQDCLLGFTYIGSGDERDHVGWYGNTVDPERLALIKRAVSLAERQFTQREIASELGVSPATVNRYLNSVSK
jgi:hypothetical protein